MIRSSIVSLGLALVLATFCPAQKPWNQQKRPAKVENDAIRTGYPWGLRPHAQPTYTPAYGYGYVGGGAAFNFGTPRTQQEGTWGRDYVGILYPRRVWLNYWRGSRYQGGTGGYKTDGPKVFGE